MDGNTTTYAYSNGWWAKTVVEGNTTTSANSGGWWAKTVSDGNTTIYTSSSGYKTVIDKQDCDIFIHQAVE
jgi:hypothetical protein